MALLGAYPNGGSSLYDDIEPIFRRHIQRSEILVDPEDLDNPVKAVLSGPVDPDILPDGGHLMVELWSEAETAEVMIVDKDKLGAVAVDSYVIAPDYPTVMSDAVISGSEEAWLKVVLAHTNWNLTDAASAASSQEPRF
jgi:hypothetical protein